MGKTVDTTLQRGALIKIRPEAFARGDEGSARFEREAKRPAALSLSIILPFLMTTAMGCTDFLRGYAEGSSSALNSLIEQHREVDGQARFVFDDFGGLNTDTLETHALPWKLVAAALMMDRAEKGEAITPEALNEVLTGFGFIVPDSIGNWKGPFPSPKFTRPIGIVAGDVTRRIPRIRVEVANLGCATCHAGVTYDEHGDPLKRVWLGLPNTSLDLEAYTWAVYRSLKEALRDAEGLLKVTRHLFPEMDPMELATLERYVMPRIAARLSELEAGIDAPTVFSNGSPGVTNGVAALKLKLDLLDPGARAEEYGTTSIPDLGGRMFRSSMLYDGGYATPGNPRFEPLTADDVTDAHLDRLARIVAFFTVPAMGIEPDSVRVAVPRVASILRFVRDYEPPPFPGPIDRQLADTGRQVYASSCAGCHGDYGTDARAAGLLRFPNRLSTQDQMGSDPHRWSAMNAELVQSIRDSAYGDHIDATTTGGYVAMPLAGLWATAPYLHNGSVPTLWHLMHPPERPRKFLVGGHRLDFERVGIDGLADAEGVVGYPEGYVAWSTPQLYDTSLPGQSNAGHEKEFEELEEFEKSAILEYLKML